jgi:hypothetical protein
VVYVWGGQLSSDFFRAPHLEKLSVAGKQYSFLTVTMDQAKRCEPLCMRVRADTSG